MPLLFLTEVSVFERNPSSAKKSNPARRTQSCTSAFVRACRAKRASRPSSKISSSLNCNAWMCPMLGVLGVIHCACSFRSGKQRETRRKRERFLRAGEHHIYTQRVHFDFHRGK